MDDDELAGAVSGLGVGEATGGVEVADVGVGVGVGLDVVGVTDSSGVSGELVLGTGVGVEVTEKVFVGVDTPVGAPVFDGAAEVGVEVGAVAVGPVVGVSVGRLVADEIALLAWLASDEAADSRSLRSGSDTSPQPANRAPPIVTVRITAGLLRRMKRP